MKDRGPVHWLPFIVGFSEENYFRQFFVAFFDPACNDCLFQIGERCGDVVNVPAINADEN